MFILVLTFPVAVVGCVEFFIPCSLPLLSPVVLNAAPSDSGLALLDGERCVVCDFVVFELCGFVLVFLMSEVTGVLVVEFSVAFPLVDGDPIVVVVGNIVVVIVVSDVVVVILTVVVVVGDVVVPSWVLVVVVVGEEVVVVSGTLTAVVSTPLACVISGTLTEVASIRCVVSGT